IALAIDRGEIVVSKLAPFFLHFALELFPVSFNSVPVHGVSPYFRLTRRRRRFSLPGHFDAAEQITTTRRPHRRGRLNCRASDLDSERPHSRVHCKCVEWDRSVTEIATPKQRQSVNTGSNSRGDRGRRS